MKSKYNIQKRRQDLTGMRSGKLVVLREVEGNGYIRAWEVKCDCGSIRVVRHSSVSTRRTKSCGCLKIEGRHGDYKSPEYSIWRGMKYRVKHSNGQLFMCDSWKLYENFLKDMGRKPGTSYSLDRIDTFGGYTPENCRWATKTEQAQNTKSNRLVEINGVKKCITQWSRDFGIHVNTLSGRLNRGMFPEKAVSLETKKCVINNRFRKHGEAASRKSYEYRTWLEMKRRCSDSRRPSFRRYGGKGIRVCDRWNNSFDNFLEDMGRKPDGSYSLDRIDPTGNYEPSNCRWVQNNIQQINKSTSIYLTFNGEIKHISEWARCLKISRRTIYMRLRRGWSIEKSLTTPVT